MKTIIDLYPQYQDKSYGDKILLSIYYLRVMIERHLEMRLEPFGITAAQFRALSVIYETKQEGLPVYQLRQFVSEPSNGDVSRMIIRLEKNGWVKRKPSKKDKRNVMAMMTPKGTKLIERLITDPETLQLPMPELDGKPGQMLYEHLQIMVNAFAKLPK